MAVRKNKLMLELAKKRQDKEQQEKGLNKEVNTFNRSQTGSTMTGSRYQQEKQNELDGFEPSRIEQTSKNNITSGVMSIINSKSAKRVSLSQELLNKLENPSKVAISFSSSEIAIGEALPNNYNQLTLKSVGSKKVIYSTSLVFEITKKYDLDFTNRTSITFSNVRYIESNGKVIAIISVGEEE